jgi:hypothetical protein
MSLSVSLASCSGGSLGAIVRDAGIDSEDAPASEASPTEATRELIPSDLAPLETDTHDAVTTDDAVSDGDGAGELAMLGFGSLPINSVRRDVFGIEPTKGLCVDIVWDFSNTGHMDGRHCDDFGPNFPYVFIAMSGCDSQPLHYAGNATVLGANGCVEFMPLAPNPSVSLDVTLQVQSDLFTGTIRARR